MPYSEPSGANSYSRLLNSFQKNTLKAQINGSKSSHDLQVTFAKLNGIKKVVCTDQGNHIT